MINIFGRDYEEIGDKDKGLILNNSGKIKLLWGKTYIDLLDNEGNLNTKALKLIKLVSSKDVIKSDGFYYVDGTLVVYIGGTLLELTSASAKEELDKINTKVNNTIETLNNTIKLLTDKIQELENGLVYT